MFSAYRTIEGASREFMILTMPLMLAFAAAMAVSNIALLLHERHRLWNALGLMVSGLLILGEAIGFLLFTRDFAGPEWEARMNNTAENVYATIFVYFECMLVGAVICGLTAARHQPAPDQDVIVILGCWFRKDGTLPPLLRGRVDRALDFWKAQKASTGKEALFIPSGGQGADEPMPEAEAMRLYLEAQGVPPELIVPETRSLNTYQNMAFSREIADGRQVRGKAVFATTNYHVFRSGVWANQAGFPAEGIGARTRWWYWPNAFMRECIGLLQKRWKQEILLLVLLVAFFGLLSLVLW
jgi:vancomycin permeability regulator SanA